MFWVLVVAYTISEVVLKRKFDIEYKMKYFHIFVWSISVVLTVLPLTTNNYGPAVGFCWISNEGDSHDETMGNVWRLVTWYVPLYLELIYMCWIYWRTTRLLDGANETFWRMRFYPLVLVIAYSFATINRIYQMATDDYSFPLTILQIFFQGSIGFLNAMVYGCNSAVKEKNKTWLNSMGMFKSDKKSKDASASLLADGHPDDDVPFQHFTPDQNAIAKNEGAESEHVAANKDSEAYVYAIVDD